jgi:hypothetical protein
LEDNLQQLSYTLQPFSEVEQVEFLKKFWLQTLNIEVTDQNRFQVYAETLIRKLAQSISDKEKEFTGIPLQTRMLAEAFMEGFRLFCQSDESEPELPHKLDLLGLYERFIESKYYIYYNDKCKTAAGNVGVKEQRESYLKRMQVEHQLLALEALFTEDEVTFLHNGSLSTSSLEELARIGIAQRNSEGKPQFIHRTFAEFFVAEFLIKQLAKKSKQSTQLQDFLLNKILLRPGYQVIRAFLDGLLNKIQPSEEALKYYGEKLNEKRHEREEHKYTAALNQAATEDNVNIVEFILQSIKSTGSLNNLHNMLFAKDERLRSALYLAGQNGSLQALGKLEKWVQEVASTPRHN